jgi:hypothetical protein
MFYQNDYIVKTLKEQQIHERVRQAEVDHLADSLRPSTHDQASRLARKSLHLLGHLMLAAGERLENFGTADTHLTLKSGAGAGDR